MNTPSEKRRPAKRDTAPLAPAAERDAEPSDTADGLQALRGWLGLSLQTARQSAALLEDLQRLNTQAFRSWVESLALAEREAGQADGLAALMALPAQVWNRQLDVWTRRLNEGSQHVLEAELQWAEDARTRARTLGLPWWPGQGLTALPAGPPVGADGAVTADPLAAFGQMQNAWLALSQRWIDGVAANGPARN